MRRREAEVVGRKVAALVPPEDCDHIDVSNGSPSTCLSWYVLTLSKTEDGIEKVGKVSAGARQQPCLSHNSRVSLPRHKVSLRFRWLGDKRRRVTAEAI